LALVMETTALSEVVAEAKEKVDVLKKQSSVTYPVHEITYVK